jgi:hypothetical protein
MAHLPPNLSLTTDANVVLVKVDGKDLYCDPGAAFTPFGLLEWTETGVEGLRLDKNGGTWVRTTLPESSASSIERNADLTLSETGTLEGKTHDYIHRLGSYAAALRRA